MTVGGSTSGSEKSASRTFLALFVRPIPHAARIPRKKFIFAILIGKFFSIVFWGYIGKSILESLTDLKSLIYIFITLVLAFILSKIVSQKLNLE